jgi:hypothetical protein
MPRENEQEFLDAVLQGNKSAVEFCQIIFRISQTWDDLVDRDKNVTNDDINIMMFEALVSLPENHFYQQHAIVLTPLLRSYITDWLAANELQVEDSEKSKQIAFVIRSSVSSIITQCAYLIGGYSWMCKVNAEVRHHIHEDTFVEYLRDFER